MTSPSAASPPPAGGAVSGLDPEFLALLACPRCAERPPLRVERDALVCALCGRVYPVVDGLPDLRLTEEELAAAAGAAPSSLPGDAEV